MFGCILASKEVLPGSYTKVSMPFAIYVNVLVTHGDGMTNLQNHILPESLFRIFGALSS